MVPRNVFFLLFNVLFLALFSGTLNALARFAFKSDDYSYIILIPLLSAWLVFQARRKIFSGVKYGLAAGTVLLIVGTLVYGVGMIHLFPLRESDQLCLATLSTVIFWTGGFVLFYGTQAFRAALFPVCFLLFMVPFPGFLLDAIIHALQRGSSGMTGVFFKLAGTQAFREENTFFLPGFSIEVARQCSGIRSSFGLVIASLLAGHLYLRTTWKKIALILSVFPVLIVKNAFRIVTLSLLAIHVDPKFLTGRLHHQGGSLFFAVALAILAPLLCLLHRSENKPKRQQVAARE